MESEKEFQNDMKRLVLYFLIVIVAIGCEKKESLLTVSTDVMHFGVEGGENEVVISSDALWDYECESDWILVRQKKDLIRVIVDANYTDHSREGLVRINVSGKEVGQVTITQDAITLEIDIEGLVISSRGDVVTIPVNSNYNWVVDETSDWVDNKINADSLVLIVDRNYQMSERVCNIDISSGEITKQISLTQEACLWNESFEMVKVDSGSFLMGAQKESESSDNYDSFAFYIESPVHAVELDSFYISKYEVTQQQWQSALGENPSINKGETYPVENVTWDDVQLFIAYLNEQTGENYRLPTEAEWEFAAKGGNKSEGYIYSGSKVLGFCGWYYSNSVASTHPVGSKMPNELGLYDMSGNVREWCSDWFDHYDSDNSINPQGPEYGVLRVNRGGSWATPSANCRNSYRHNDYPNESFSDLGFRLALTK